MASGPDKPKDSAEKAYAVASAKATPAKPLPAKKKPVAAKAKKVVRTRRAPKVAAKVAAKVARPVAAAAVPVSPGVETPVVAAPEPVVPAVAADVANAPVVPIAEVELPAEAAELPAPIKISPPKPTITELKEKIMASAKTPDFTKPVADAIGEIQTRAKAAYEKGTESLTEATEFAKGNVEAFVESGKILAAGAQDLGKTYVEEAKSAYEVLTGDLKEIAAIKSPTELFQLQGKIARRNFDMFVAASSKNTEAFLKLANDTVAPLTGRVEVATAKLAKVA